MGGLSPIHWLLIIGVIVLLFGGRGKISDLMGDFAKGIRSFKKGLNDPEEERAITDRRDETAGKDTTSGH